jgi:hypothetical protein
VPLFGEHLSLPIQLGELLRGGEGISGWGRVSNRRSGQQGPQNNHSGGGRCADAALQMMRRHLAALSLPLDRLTGFS